jgi:NAD(P)-dependent dehydrogenase (short-subunit alcohol dehydrogenase family)
MCKCCKYVIHSCGICGIPLVNWDQGSGTLVLVENLICPPAWFISGADQGIRFELVKIVARLGYVVFAGTCNPSNATHLQQLAAENSNIHIIQLEPGSISDAAAAATVVKEVTGGLDVVVANAGIASDWQRITEIDLQSLYDYYNVNAMGPIILF